MSGGYQPPVNVSPLIRGARWTLLIAGIIYGSSKKRYYASVEKGLEKERFEQKLIDDVLKARKRSEQAAIEAVALALLSPPILPIASQPPEPLQPPPPPPPESVSENRTTPDQPKLKTIRTTPSKLSIIPPPELKPPIPSAEQTEFSSESDPPQPEKLLEKKRRIRRYED